MPPKLRRAAVYLTASVGAACGGGGGDGSSTPTPSPPDPAPPPPPTLSVAASPCINGMAGSFECDGIALKSRVPFSSIGGSAGNDIWGWYDEETGREFALVGMTNGTAFVDVSDPESPTYIGRLPTETISSGWRDIKVFGHHAYIVADGAGSHGMQVFDLRRLRDVASPQLFGEDFLYSGFENAHNLAINESSGFAFAVGTNTCDEGLHMIDLSSPANPVFAGCYSATETHDTQCVSYRGPDARYSGREICFSSNADHVEIVDVSDKSAPLNLSSIIYPDIGFVHQGWLSEDQRYLFIGDELDEIDFSVGTRTHVIDVSNLDAPVYMFSYEAANQASDHNLYVRGNRIFEGNYASGLRVIDVDGVSSGSLSEVAYFDTYPTSDDPGFDGVWSVYPYFPSGTLIVNDRENGLFVLTMEIAAAYATVPDSAVERETIDLGGVVSGNAVTTEWAQTGGTAATISAVDQPTTSATLPALDASEWLSFSLTVTDGFGNRSVDFVRVFVSALPSAATFSVSDPALDQCIDLAEIANGYDDIGQITSIDCAGVSDIDGLAKLVGLSELRLPHNALSVLTPLLAIDGLESIDVRGNSSLPCAELNRFEAELGANVQFQADETCRRAVTLNFGTSGFDVVVDEPSRRIFVSVPDHREIAVVDIDSMRIVERILMPGKPHGIDLSIDGTRLFAALADAGSVAQISLADYSFRVIELDGMAGSATIFDIVEASENRLFATARENHQFDYVVQVKLDDNDAVTRVAGGAIIETWPILERSAAGDFVYLEEPRTFYQLSLADPDAGIARQYRRDLTPGFGNFAVNAAGSRIALHDGVVLDSGSLSELGRISAGVVTVSAAGDQFAVTSAGESIEIFDAITLQRTLMTEAGCALSDQVSKLRSFKQDRNFAVLAGEELCVAVDTLRGAKTDPYAGLGFRDLEFEACVRAIGAARGWLAASEFLELDCGSAAGILHLDGIEAMTNLILLDVSNSAVFDLSPLISLGSLESLEAANTPIADLSPLLEVPSLATLDVSGSINVSCDQLDSLTLGAGVTVAADSCTRSRVLDLGGLGADLELDEASGRAFVSVPELSLIQEVDLTTFTVARVLVTTGAPYGIDLSADGSTIYVALGQIGSLGYIDEETGAEEVVDILTELDHESAFDVAEVSENRILVTASPYSSGFAYVVEVRRDLGNAATRVADGLIVRTAPEITVSVDRTVAYVTDSSGTHVLKLDATQAELPIIGHDDRTSEWSAHLRLSPDELRFVTRSGQVFSAETIRQIGRVGFGVSLFTADGTRIFSGDSSSLIGGDEALVGVGIYDATTYHQVGKQHWGCALDLPRRMVELANGQVLVMGDDVLCTVETVAY